AYYRVCKAAGVAPDHYHERPDLWDPVGLPGKAGFDTAHRARNSRVEPVVGDFMAVDIDMLGAFDVVFFLGVLYHLEEPLTGLRRLRHLTRELAVIETVATYIEGQAGRPLAEFFPFAELDGDVSNWWATNDAALHAMCRDAGFATVETVAAPPPEALDLVRGAAAARVRAVRGRGIRRGRARPLLALRRQQRRQGGRALHAAQAQRRPRRHPPVRRLAARDRCAERRHHRLLHGRRLRVPRRHV